MALRVALIGCGGIAGAHVRGWLAVAGRADLAAVVDTNAANRRRVREQIERQRAAPLGGGNGLIREYDDYNRLLTELRPDVVDICLPHHLHKDCIVAACRQRVHWLCEKPLCLNLAEAEEIRQAMREANVVGMCAHNQIFMPAFCEAKRLLNDGALGRIYTVLSQDCFVMGLPPPGVLPDTPGTSPVAAGTWRADREKMGGGELIDTGYHPSYRLLYLAGETPADVFAITARHRLKDMEGEDTALALCRFPSGATGEVRTSWAMELPSGHSLFHVIGERGELYGSAERLFFQPNRMKPATLEFPAVDTFVAEIRHFVECLETGRKPVQTHADGIAVLEFISRAYEFARRQGMGS